MNYIDLFAGIGGFRLGIGDRGECVYTNEWDKYATQIYEKNFKTKVDTRDITIVRTSEIPDHDLLVAGFPCQAFSIAGKRQGFNDTKGTLFFDIARILKDKRPRYLLLENVKGLLSHEGGKTFQTILGVLTDLGYECEWKVLSSGFYTQQDRQRVYIFGVLRRNNDSRNLRKLGFMGELDKRATNTIPTISTKPIGRGECIIIEAKGKRRWLTPTECERLQGFPDGWTEGVSDTQRYKTLGNAVTVNVVEEIFKRLGDI